MSSEDVRYSVAVGNPPDAPQAYDDRYKLPVHSDKSLQLRFVHPLDHELRFYEKPHIYTFRGRCTTASVSGLIKPYCEEFNATLIIARMRSSKREAWPRVKYAYNALVVEDPSTLKPEELVLVVDANGLTKYAGTLASSPRVATGEVLYTYERALTDEEISTKWADPEARNRGTEAHYQVERYLNSMPTHEDFTELELAKGFMRDHLVPLGAKAFRTEWEIVAVEEDVAGSIDAVFVLQSGELIICDWKRSAKLSENVHSSFSKRRRPPFQHIDGNADSACISMCAYVSTRTTANRTGLERIEQRGYLLNHTVPHRLDRTTQNFAELDLAGPTCIEQNPPRVSQIVTSPNTLSSYPSTGGSSKNTTGTRSLASASCASIPMRRFTRGALT